MLNWTLGFVAFAVVVLAIYGGRRFIAGEAQLSRESAAQSEMTARPASDEALLEIMRRHPRTVSPSIGWIDRSLHAGDAAEALRRAEEVLRRFPRNEDCLARKGIALLHSGRIDEAEAFAAAQVRRFPRSSWFHSLLVDTAMARNDHATVLARCAAMRARFPAWESGYRPALTILLARGDLDEAEAIAEAGIREVGGHGTGEVFRLAAAVAERRGDPATAADRLVAGVEEDVGNPTLYVAASRALSAAGRPDEARDILDRARIRFPGHADITAAYDALAGAAA